MISENDLPPMPNADLTTALARVDRAFTHRKELWDTALEHLKANPIKEHFDIQSGEVRIVVQAPLPFPVEISIMFGEWLYNLRAAMDSLLYELAIEDTAKDPPTAAGARQYPIFISAEDFAAKSKRPLSGLSEWTRTGIENTQPYHIPTGHKGHALWWLNELAKLDRHRRHHLFEWRVVDLMADANSDKFLREGIRTCDKNGAFVTDQESLELVRYQRRDGTTPEGQDLFIKYTVLPDIPEWVEQAVPGFGAEARLDHRMATIEEVVRLTIEHFRDRLPERTSWSERANIDM